MSLSQPQSGPSYHRGNHICRRFARGITVALIILTVAACSAARHSSARIGADATAAPRIFETKVPFKPLSSTRLSRLLHVSVLLPNAEGPYPAVVLNHGSPRSAEARANRAQYPATSEWFLSRGFAVIVPNRRGYGGSDGPYSEGFGQCQKPDYVRAGRATAFDIGLVLRWLRKQPWIQRGNVIVAGASAGGWGALAVGGDDHRDVAGVINFAGGRGSPRDGFNCGPDRLVLAAGQFGRQARVPSLWLYSVDDPYFPPRLTQRMYKAYQEGAAVSSLYVLIPRDMRIGHSLMSSRRGPLVWGRYVDEFLRQVLRTENETLLNRSSN